MNAKLPSVPLRPGEDFPHWPSAPSQAARETLLTYCNAVDMALRWGGYSAAEDRLRTAVLMGYLRQGRAPRVEDLITETDLSPSELETCLASLETRDMILRDASNGAVTGAYPVTDRVTGHVVRLDGVQLNAICAIDALGTGAMYGRDMEIESSCKLCGAPVAVTTSGQGTALDQAVPPEALVWMDLREGAQGVTSRCPMMVFFCSPAHLDQWRATGVSVTGARLSLEEAFQIGKAIFAPTLRPGRPGQP